MAEIVHLAFCYKRNEYCIAKMATMKLFHSDTFEQQNQTKWNGTHKKKQLPFSIIKSQKIAIENDIFTGFDSISAIAQVVDIFFVSIYFSISLNISLSLYWKHDSNSEYEKQQKNRCEVYTKKKIGRQQHCSKSCANA